MSQHRPVSLDSSLNYQENKGCNRSLSKESDEKILEIKTLPVTLPRTIVQVRHSILSLPPKTPLAGNTLDSIKRPFRQAVKQFSALQKAEIEFVIVKAQQEARTQTWEVFYHHNAKPSLGPTRRQDEGEAALCSVPPFQALPLAFYFALCHSLLRFIPRVQTRSSWACGNTDGAALLARDTIKQLAELPCYTRYNVVVIPELYSTMKRCFY